MNKKFTKAAPFFAGSSLVVLAFFAQACGKGNSSLPLVPITSSVTSCSYAGCGSTGPTNADLYGQCQYEGGQYIMMNGVSICRVSSGWISYDTSSSSTQMVMNPNPPSGGVNVSGAAFYPGDKVVVQTDGHYNWVGYSGCGDISVLGNWNNVLIKDSNGVIEGLIASFVDGSGNYSPETAITVQGSSQSQTLNVPASSPGPFQLDLGYYVGTNQFKCGDISVSYQITRCVDSNGNTYACN